MESIVEKAARLAEERYEKGYVAGRKDKADYTSGVAHSVIGPDTTRGAAYCSGWRAGWSAVEAPSGDEKVDR